LRREIKKAALRQNARLISHSRSLAVPATPTSQARFAHSLFPSASSATGHCLLPHSLFSNLMYPSGTSTAAVPFAPCATSSSSTLGSIPVISNFLPSSRTNASGATHSALSPFTSRLRDWNVYAPPWYKGCHSYTWRHQSRWSLFQSSRAILPQPYGLADEVRYALTLILQPYGMAWKPIAPDFCEVWPQHCWMWVSLWVRARRAGGGERTSGPRLVHWKALPEQWPG
jgi:hypothetical protein